MKLKSYNNNGGHQMNRYTKALEYYETIGNYDFLTELLKVHPENAQINKALELNELAFPESLFDCIEPFYSDYNALCYELYIKYGGQEID